MTQTDRSLAQAEALRHTIMAHGSEIRDAMEHKIKTAKARGDNARAAIYEIRRGEFERMLREARYLDDPDTLLKRYSAVGRSITAAAKEAIRTGRMSETEMAAIGDEMARIAEQFDD